VLQDFASPLRLNALNVLTGRDKFVIKSHCYPKHIQHSKLSSMILKLIAVKINKVAKPGNIVIFELTCESTDCGERV